MNRVVVWFSCGAASAVSAKLAISKYGHERVHIVYCDTGSEHPDNKRFFKDCEKWFDHKIEVLKSDKFKDVWDVYEKTRWLAGIGGARCTTEMKKKLRIQYEDLEDIQIFGYTSEEKHRADRFNNNNPELTMEWILIDKDVNKQECLALIARANIEIPEMYKLGYNNNNCIGCPKAANFNYWRMINRDFPETYERMSKVERKLNVAINKKYIKGVRTRVFLDELDLTVPIKKDEIDISCGLSCGIIAEEIEEKV